MPYEAPPSRTTSAALSSSRLYSSKDASIGRTRALPPGPSKYPSSEMMVETMSLRMVHSLGLAFRTITRRETPPAPDSSVRRRKVRGNREATQHLRVNEAGDPRDPAVAQVQHVDRAQP